MISCPHCSKLSDSNTGPCLNCGKPLQSESTAATNGGAGATFWADEPEQDLAATPAPRPSMGPRRRLGETLIAAGVLTPEQLERAIDLQKKRQLRLGTVLLQEGFVSETQLMQALSRQLSIPCVSLWNVDIPDEVLGLVPSHVAEEFFLIPIYVRASELGERFLYVAMNDPTDDSALRFVAATAGMPVKPMIAAPSDVAAAIQLYYYGVEIEEEFEPPAVTDPPALAVQQAGAAPPPVPPKPQAAPPPKPKLAAAPPPAPQSAKDADSWQKARGAQEPIPKTATPVVPEPLPEQASTDVKAEAPPEEDSQRVQQREVEKHMFGLGRRASSASGLKLTLLDGMTISFGAAAKQNKTDRFTPKDLIQGLRAAAEGTPIEGFLPAEEWQTYMASLLKLLLRKRLIQFDELMDELKKGP